MMIHFSRPAPTYETATTRQFYNGRTETMRSCTEEAVEFAHSMLNPKASVCSLIQKMGTKFCKF